MINLSFNIRNPWSSRFVTIFSKSGKTPFANKFWELEFLKTSDIIGFQFNLTTRQSHAGLYVSIALFGYALVFNFYDSRHWDGKNNCWEIYDEPKT